MIDQLLLGRSERSVAAQFNLTQSTIHRHTRCPRLHMAGTDDTVTLVKIHEILQVLTDTVRDLVVQRESRRNEQAVRAK